MKVPQPSAFLLAFICYLVTRHQCVSRGVEFLPHCSNLFPMNDFNIFRDTMLNFDSTQAANFKTFIPDVFLLVHLVLLIPISIIQFLKVCLHYRVRHKSLNDLLKQVWHEVELSHTRNLFHTFFVRYLEEIILKI